MFVYIKDKAENADLTNFAGESVLPIAWFWERIGSSPDIFLAYSLFCGFFFYGLVSVPELVGWIFYMVGSGDFAAYYATGIGYWGSLVLYVIPWTFALAQLWRQFRGNTRTDPGRYCLFLMVTGALLWVIHGNFHLFYAHRFVAHV